MPRQVDLHVGITPFEYGAPWARGAAAPEQYEGDPYFVTGPTRAAATLCAILALPDLIHGERVVQPGSGPAPTMYGTGWGASCRARRRPHFLPAALGEGERGDDAALQLTVYDAGSGQRRVVWGVVRGREMR